LLKIIAGVLEPTVGSIKTLGKISPMIELGAGFDMELTARENIFLNGAVLGYSKKFLQDKFDEIIDFAELQDFVDVPVRNFSSGMVARLAFAISTMVQPEILIVDEILSVGDLSFQKKSEKKMLSMINGGATVIFVSHTLESIQKVCQTAIWLNQGKIMNYGNSKDICFEYVDYLELNENENKQNDLPQDKE